MDIKKQKKEILNFGDLDIFSEIINKSEVEKFYINSIKVLSENDNFLASTDSISIFNCLLSLDELYSKLKEREEFYTNSNVEIINFKIKGNEAIIKNLEKSFEIYQNEIKSLLTKKTSITKRIASLENRRIDFKTKSSSRKNKIEADFKSFIKICNKPDSTELELTKFQLKKTDKEFKNQKLIDSYSLEISKIEDDIFKNEQELPKISEKISSINEKLSNSQNNVQHLKQKIFYLKESLKFKYINISDSGKPYSNEVYSIKSFIKDVQNLLKDNGLTPLSRIKTNILLGIESEEEDENLTTHLKNIISLEKN